MSERFRHDTIFFITEDGIQSDAEGILILEPKYKLDDNHVVILAQNGRSPRTSRYPIADRWEPKIALLDNVDCCEDPPEPLRFFTWDRGVAERLIEFMLLGANLMIGLYAQRARLETTP